MVAPPSIPRNGKSVTESTMRGTRRLQLLGMEEIGRTVDGGWRVEQDAACSMADARLGQSNRRPTTPR